MDTRRTAGAGLLAYGIGTPVAFMSIGAPGGAYDDHAVTTYLSSGHWVIAFLLAYLGAFAALGLLVFARGLAAELGEAADTVRGLLLGGMTAGVVGWFLVGGLSVAFAEGGSPVAGRLPHSTVYLLSEMSNLIAVCASSFLVGAAALVTAKALRGSLPGWLRVATYVAGVCGLFGPGFFTLFLFWLWAIAFGVWLIASRRTSPARERLARAAV